MPVVLCAPQVRIWVRRIIDPALGQVVVMSFNEVVRGQEVESHGVVVLDDESQDV